MRPKISLFASSIRPHLWEALFKSMEGTSIDVEVVFAGNVIDNWDIYPQLKYIKTENIKPSQCYEVARRACTGELIHWTADDCEYKNDILGKAYRYWREQENNKLILSLQTKENYVNMVMTDMTMHSFFGNRRSTPLMAPLALMNRQYLEDLGGYDRRYICGQAENDVVMRAYADGGSCEIFGDDETCIEIDHITKHGGSHQGRTFAKGYPIDRKVLEDSWVKDRKVTLIRNDKFEPFENKDLLAKSQSNNLEIWE